MEVEISQRDGSRLSKADFDVVKREVMALSQRQEGLRPEDLLELARPVSSNLHKFFEWNDHKAAESYRLEQARKLIYTVTIRVIEDGEEPKRSNFAVRIIDIETGKSSYRPLHEVMKDPVQRAALVQRALDELAAWEARYQHLNELSTLFAASDVLRKKVQALVRAAPAPRRRKAK